MPKGPTPRPKVVKTSLMLPKKLWTEIKVRALREERDAQVIVAEALEDYLRKTKKGGDSR